MGNAPFFQFQQKNTLKIDELNLNSFCFQGFRIFLLTKSQSMDAQGGFQSLKLEQHNKEHRSLVLLWKSQFQLPSPQQTREETLRILLSLRILGIKTIPHKLSQAYYHNYLACNRFYFIKFRVLQVNKQGTGIFSSSQLTFFEYKLGILCSLGHQ